MQRRKKRIKLEVVIDEALKLLPKNSDIEMPVFIDWVNKVFEQNKTLPVPPTRKDYEHYKKYLDDDCPTTIINGFSQEGIGEC